MEVRVQPFIFLGVDDKLNENAWFVIKNDDGTFSDVDSSFNSSTGEWTLNDINVLDLGNVEIFHPTYYGDVNVSVVMTDGTATTNLTPSARNIYFKYKRE